MNAKEAYNKIAAWARDNTGNPEQDDYLMDLVNKLWDAADSEARVDELPD